MNFSAKELRFVEEYLVDLDATKAALRAGYSAKSAASIGWENLRKPKIQAVITAAMKARSDRTKITADAVLEELRRIGFADIRQVVAWQSNVRTTIEDPETGEMDLVHVNDVELVRSEELPDKVASAIAEVSMSKAGALKIKMHPKLPALVKLGEHLGLFRPAQPKPKDPAGAGDKPNAPTERDEWNDILPGQRPN